MPHPRPESLRLVLTDKSVAALPYTGGQYVARDESLPGFFVTVGARAKTYYAQGDLWQGARRRTVKVKIGRVEDISAREARAEAKAQLLERTGGLPDVVVACVGGGSNAIGMFAEFIDDPDVELVGVEPGGHGLDSGEHGATINNGSIGILHGARSYVMRTSEGQVEESYSISAGLDYPGVGPQHAHLSDTGRASYVAVTDAEALQAFQLLSRKEGIIPALESSHALAYALKRAAAAERDQQPVTIVVSLSGRGDKDVEHVRRTLEAHPELVLENM